jgi:hypothetical protein
MQFNRYTFFSNYKGSSDINDVTDPKNFTTFIKSCGFVHADGSEIDPSVPVENFKWKYENSNTNPFWQKNIGTYYNDLVRYLFMYNGSYSSGGLFTCNDSHDATPYSHACFFIPLKNNGFILFSYPMSGSYGSYNANPKLISATRGCQEISFGSTTNFWISYFLGFFNNVTNNYWYFRTNGRIYDNPQPTFGIYNTGLYNHGTDMTNIRNDYLDCSATKTDYKQNICTLIKAPCSDGFLSNLYIVSTSPSAPVQTESWKGQQNFWIGTDNRFFSFNGRNFYGFMNNLAVELPSD